jgi:DNA-binding transcriptional regulator WhiA
MEEIIFPNQIRMFRRLRGKDMQELADHLKVSKSCLNHRMRRLMALSQAAEEK